ncbi:hypothetical protein Agub_g14303, partial [Astrephomene gubernaculifera]
MRTSLGDSLEYLEADLQATIGLYEVHSDTGASAAAPLASASAHGRRLQAANASTTATATSSATGSSSSPASASASAYATAGGAAFAPPVYGKDTTPLIPTAPAVDVPTISDDEAAAPSSTDSEAPSSSQCACIQIYAPVCGSNGKEFSNACEAWCAGVLTWTPGSCDGTGLFNGNFSDGGFSSAETVDTNPRSWGLDRIDQVSLPLNGGYSPGRLDGAGTHIYILDTGVRTSHSAFSGRVGEGTSMLGGSYQDDNGHGTHVAGTALGATYGVARAAILHPVKVMDSQGSGSYSDIIAGLGWVKDHVARNGYKQAVVTMSLEGPRAASLNDAVTALTDAGIAVVVAAGNDKGGDTCSYSPASAPAAIAVGASNRDDTMASFSNIGSCVFTFAPGSYIVSASYSGDYAEATMSG